MKLSVFIRTYKGDFDWLPYCLAGLKKNVTYDELVICTPDVNELQPLITGIECKVVGTKDMVRDGWMAQQIDKMNAWQHCAGDVIMFVDSDTVFHTKVSLNDFVINGRINLLRTKYEDIQCDKGMFAWLHRWKVVTAKATGFVSDWEYMRRFPFVYWRDTLVNINIAYPGLSFYITKQKNRGFSEFNFIGQFIERYEYHKYNLINTMDGMPPDVCKQFRSWDRVNENYKNEIQELLK